jgi:O-antigen/teichoic acid export membrane protein
LTGHRQFLQASGVLFLANAGSNVLGYLFHVFISRALGPAEYGIFNTLLSLLLLIGIPAAAIQTVGAKHVAMDYATASLGRIRDFLVRAVLRSAVWGSAGAAAFLVLALPVARFFQLPSAWPVVVLSLVVFVSFLQPVLFGGLQGLQRFVSLGALGLVGSLLRIVAGVTLVLIGFGASGALGASALAAGGTVLLSLFLLWPLLREPRGLGSRGGEGRPLKGYAWPVLGSLACFTAFANADVLMVKHYFPPVEAGHYSAVAVVGRAFLFLPGAIIAVLFPHVAHRHERGEGTGSVLAAGLALTAGLSFGGVVLASVWPELIARSLFGPEFLDAVALIRVVGFAYTPLALVSLLVNYLLALEHRQVLFYLGGALLLYGASLLLFHDSLSTVLLVLGLNAGLLFVTLQLVAIPAGRRFRGVAVSLAASLPAPCPARGQRG